MLRRNVAATFEEQKKFYYMELEVYDNVFLRIVFFENL